MKKLNSKILIKGLIFPECPRWKDNRLWFSDIYNDSLISALPNGKIVSTYNIPSIGIGWLPDNKLVYIERSLIHTRIMEYSDGQSKEYCDLSSISSFMFNDLTVDVSGNIYTGSTGVAMDDLNKIDKEAANAPLVLIPYNSNKSPIIIAENLNFPNGIAISQDNKKLVVAETFNARLTAFDILDDGTLTNRRLFAQLDKKYIADGIFFDKEGAIWVSVGINRCIRVQESGEVTHEIETVGVRCNACMMDNNGIIYLCTRGKENPESNLSPKSGMIETVQGDFIPKVGFP